jgi:hypothetical protein
MGCLSRDMRATLVRARAAPRFLKVGLVLKFKLPNGPVLKDVEGKPILGAGIVDTTLTIDLASGDVLSVESTWHGPHPLRDGVDICGPAIAYLT